MSTDRTDGVEVGEEEEPLPVVEPIGNWSVDVPTFEMT
jgi:hypothetical protein